MLFVELWDSQPLRLKQYSPTQNTKSTRVHRFGGVINTLLFSSGSFTLLSFPEDCIAYHSDENKQGVLKRIEMRG